MGARDLFATRLWEDDFSQEEGFRAFRDELEQACRMIATEDLAGRRWCRTNGYGGYTSYASLNDLPSRATVLARLKKRVDRQVAAFAKDLALDFGAGRLRLDGLWISLLRRGAGHSGHVHPLSVVSGVFFVAAPPAAGALRLEDPRLPLMMAAPPPRADAPEARRRFINLRPQAGRLVLWESWLRHEVLQSAARADRISVSFNYGWR